MRASAWPNSVAEVAEQRQGPLVAGGGGRVVPGQLLHQAQVGEGVGLGQPVARVAGQRQRLLVAGGGGRVVPGPACTRPSWLRA